MKFAIAVHEGPCQHRASHTAYHLTRSLPGNGHQVVRVFFYHDGVNNGTCHTTALQDEPYIVELWSHFFRLDLVACVAAARRRSLTYDREKPWHAIRAANLVPGFRMSGLGQLIVAAIGGERPCAMPAVKGGLQV